MTYLTQSRTKINQVRAMVLSLLSLLLSSCSNNSAVPETIHTIPTAFLLPLDKTPFKGQSYGDITNYAVILKRERDVCLNRIDRIREWQVQHAQQK